MLDFADPTVGDLQVSPDLKAPLQLGTTDNALSPSTGKYKLPDPTFWQRVIAHESGGNPNVGWGNTDLSGVLLDPTGFPDWAGKPGPAGISTAAGLYGITKTNWHRLAPELGVSDFSPESQAKVRDALYKEQGPNAWVPYWQGSNVRNFQISNGLMQPQIQPQTQQQQPQTLDAMLSSGSAGDSAGSPWTRLLALSAALQGTKVQPVQVKYDPSKGVVASPAAPTPSRLGPHTGSLPDLPYTTRVGMRSFWQD